MRKSFIFYRSFYDAVKTLPIKIQAEIYNAIADYALNGNQPTDISPIALSIFTIIQPQIDANTRRYENGCKGGAPPGNKNAKKTNQRQPKTTKTQPTNNQQQPNLNLMIIIYYYLILTKYLIIIILKKMMN